MSDGETRLLALLLGLDALLSSHRRADRRCEHAPVTDHPARLGPLLVARVAIARDLARLADRGTRELAPSLRIVLVPGRASAVFMSDTARSRSALLVELSTATSAAVSAADRAYCPCRCGSDSDCAICKSLSASPSDADSGAVMSRTVRSTQKLSPPPEPNLRRTSLRDQIRSPDHQGEFCIRACRRWVEPTR